MTPIVIVSIFLIIVAFGCWLFRSKLHPWLISNATLLGSYRSLTTLILFPLALLGGVYTYTQIIEKLEKPSVTLEFQSLNATSVAVKNISKSTVVQQPKYWVVLFNLDSNELERKQPLLIPARTGDYIKPGNRWGPNGMLSLPKVEVRIKNGDRLLGSAYVTCPECNTRSYLVYIKVGEFGWYTELHDEEGQTLLVDLKNAESIEESITSIENQISKERRIKIR